MRVFIGMVGDKVEQNTIVNFLSLRKRKLLKKERSKNKVEPKPRFSNRYMEVQYNGNAKR